MELFKLMGTIALQGRDEFNRDLDSVSDRTEKFANKLKNGLGKAAKIGAKAATAAITAAGTAIGFVIKNAIEDFGEYEQLVGGVETLFKDSADTVMQYAENAYKTAGLSANEYMETVTSFSASLLQSLDGDTQAAAEKADMAITDMADNANKMGTDMESIQNAYQGFAKQNYTMLDNLKLGYGGTKEEMQRLLKDAEKISGIKYDISSYADMVDAIHVVQTEMGITGTTAAEAASTIQGSIGSAKAAWQNWLTALGDSNANMEEKTNELIESIGVAVENILPVFKQVLSSLGQALGDKLPELISQAAAFIISNLPQIIDLGWQLIKALLRGIWQGIDEVFGISDYFSQAWEDIKKIFSTVGDFFAGIWADITGWFVQAGEDIKNAFSAVGDFFAGIWQGIKDVFSSVVDWFKDIFTDAWEWIKSTPIFQWFSALFTSIWESVKSIVNVVVGLVKGCWEIIKTVWGIVSSWFNDNIITPVKEFFVGLWDAVSNAASTAWEAIKGIWNVVSSWFSDNIITPVKDFFSGMWDGLKNGASDAWEGIKEAFSAVSDWFKDIFSKAWQKVKDVFSTGGEIFDGITESIADAFKTVVNAIIGGINKVIAVPFNTINGILNWIRSIEIVGIEPFIDMWSKDPLAVPQIPLLATGGVLKKGQVGLLEGSGAEAVVPLEKNTGWINGIAERLNALQGNAPVDSNAVLAKLDAILDAILNMGDLREAIDGAALKINDREFARLVKGVG